MLFGKGSAIYSASLNESELAFSRDPKLAYGFAPYTEMFDIFSRQLVKGVSDFSKFKFPLKEKGNWSMYEKEKVRYNEMDPSEILYPFFSISLRKSVAI